MHKLLIAAGLLAGLLGVGAYLGAGPLSEGARAELGFRDGAGAIAETACTERYRVLGLELSVLGALLLGCGLLARAAQASRRKRELKRVGTWFGFAAVMLVAGAVYSVVFAANFRDRDVLERVGGRGLQLMEVEEFLAYRSDSHQSRGWILGAGGALLLPLGLLGILAAAGAARSGRLLVLISAGALLGCGYLLYGEPATARELNDFLVSGQTITQYRGLLVGAAGCLLVGLGLISGVLLAPPARS